VKNQIKRSTLVLQVGDLDGGLARKTTIAIKSQLQGVMLSTPRRQGRMYTFTVDTVVFYDSSKIIDWQWAVGCINPDTDTEAFLFEIAKFV
jgi:hypothetical protein